MEQPGEHLQWVGSGLSRRSLNFLLGQHALLARSAAVAQEQTVKSRSEETKKTQRQLVKELFTKTRDERYAEMSKFEKLGYWIFGFGVVTIMFLLWNSA